MKTCKTRKKKTENRKLAREDATWDKRFAETRENLRRFRLSLIQQQKKPEPGKSES